MKQRTFASAAYDHKKVTTKPKKILAIDGQISSVLGLIAVVSVNLALIEPHYPKKGNGQDYQLICRPCYAFIVYSNGTTYQTQG